MDREIEFNLEINIESNKLTSDDHRVYFGKTGIEEFMCLSLMTVNGKCFQTEPEFKFQFI